MASVCDDPNGRRRIAFVSPDGSRKTIRLGKVDRKVADSICGHLEHLLSSKAMSSPVPLATAAWVKEMSPQLKAKFAVAGLVEAPARKALGPFLDEFILGRKDLKPASLEVMGHTVRNLKQFFGEDKDLVTFTAGDAEQFKQWISTQSLAPATQAKRLTFARGFFGVAKRHKIIEENPFLEIKVPTSDPSRRQRFIDRETIDRLLSMANPTWRIIIGLSRFGGLRCPSEVLSLEWSHVDWERDRIYVPSPKTERYAGKESRTIPIFEDLRPFLEEAFGLAQEGQTHVVPGNHLSKAQGAHGWKNCNLRTAFGKLLKKAGVTAWPRMFHNLRSSCETELMEKFPVHVVSKWLGHDPAIALKHYSQTTDEHFAEALGKSGAKNGARVAQKAAQQIAESSCNQMSALGANAGWITTSADCCDSIQDSADLKTERKGFEAPFEIPGKTGFLIEGGAECGAATQTIQAILSPELARIIKAWDRLPPGIKAAISSMIEVYSGEED